MQGADNPVEIQPQGVDTDVKIMIESSVDPQQEVKPIQDKKSEKTNIEEDNSEAELERLEMW